MKILLDPNPENAGGEIIATSPSAAPGAAGAAAPQAQAPIEQPPPSPLQVLANEAASLVATLQGARHAVEAHLANVKAYAGSPLGQTRILTVRGVLLTAQSNIHLHVTSLNTLVAAEAQAAQD
jgi:hypothetical protein